MLNTKCHGDQNYVCQVLYCQCLEWYPAQIRCSVNIWWMSKCTLSFLMAGKKSYSSAPCCLIIHSYSILKRYLLVSWPNGRRRACWVLSRPGRFLGEPQYWDSGLVCLLTAPSSWCFMEGVGAVGLTLLELAGRQITGKMSSWTPCPVSLLPFFGQNPGICTFSKISKSKPRISQHHRVSQVWW